MGCLHVSLDNFHFVSPVSFLEVAAFQSSGSMSWGVGASEVRVSPAQALIWGLASPWVLENFKGPLKPDHVAQGIAKLASARPQ